MTNLWSGSIFLLSGLTMLVWLWKNRPKYHVKNLSRAESQVFQLIELEAKQPARVSYQAYPTIRDSVDLSALSEETVDEVGPSQTEKHGLFNHEIVQEEFSALAIEPGSHESEDKPTSLGL